MMFLKAERKSAKLRLAICGPSGSGKTHSALLLAAGLSGTGMIFVIDTERDSATLEAGKEGIPDFFHAPMEPPFTPQKYRHYMEQAAGEGADVLVIDSLSHAWTGTGGLLDMHADVSRAQKNNSWAAWREVTPEHNALVDAILQAPCHVICTLRTKTAWEVVEGPDGRKRPQKIGLKPEQREGLEYEFTLVLELSPEGHVATASKDRTSLFDGRHFVPSSETGKELRMWLESGKDAEAISRDFYEHLKKEAGAISDPDGLDEWGRAHRVDFLRLARHHRERLSEYCAERRKELKAREARSRLERAA